MRKSTISFGISRPIRLSVFLLSVCMRQFDPHCTNFSWKFIIETFIKIWLQKSCFVSRLTPNDPYMGRTAPLTFKRCILYIYIYSTNIGTEYFKHALYSPFFFSLQNAVCFIMLTCLVPVLFTFYTYIFIQQI